MIDHLILIHRRWQEKHEQIVPLLRSDLGSGSTIETGHTDVVDDHFRIVVLPPLLHIDLVEPAIILWHKVVPLQNLERFLLRASASGHDSPTSQASQERRRASHLYETSSGEMLSRAVHYGLVCLHGTSSFQGHTRVASFSSINRLSQAKS